MSKKLKILSLILFGLISFAFTDGDSTNQKQEIKEIKIDLKEIKLALLDFKKIKQDTIKLDTLNFK